MQDQASQELQELLEDFNKIDKKKLGNIKLNDAIRLLREKTSIVALGEDLLDRIIFTTEKMVTFD